MYYHVRITQKSNSAHDETKLDLTEEQLRERFLRPYELGKPIIVNGKSIPKEDIERILISRSSEDSRRLVALVKAEDRESSVIVFGGPSYEWLAANKADDVTDAFIRGPAGYKAKNILQKKAGLPANNALRPRKRQQRTSSKKVFVVHGHDHALKSDLEVFLYKLGLEPIVLHRQPDSGQTLIEKIEKNSDVAYAVIIMTPDDIAFPASQVQVEDAERNLEPRARQNVIFEFGYFAALLGRDRVCCVIKKGVTVPSDLNGFVYKEVVESIEEVGYPLMKEFQAAGLRPTIKK
jgi:predicted nucleotide-binding protein